MMMLQKDRDMLEFQFLGLKHVSLSKTSWNQIGIVGMLPVLQDGSQNLSSERTFCGSNVNRKAVPEKPKMCLPHNTAIFMNDV